MPPAPSEGLHIIPVFHFYRIATEQQNNLATKSFIKY